MLYMINLLLRYIIQFDVATERCHDHKVPLCYT
jgi:hypothetical protein